jgi:hypothetical protein
MSVSDGKLATIRALIARSASNFEEEARSSAWSACKMMRELGLDVSDPSVVNSTVFQRDNQLLRAKVVELEGVVAKMRSAVSDLVSQNTKLQADLRLSKFPPSTTIAPSPEAVAAASRALSEAMLGKVGSSKPRAKRASKKSPAKPSTKAPSGSNPFAAMPDSGRIIRSQYAGICRSCRAPIEVGDSVFWTPGAKGVICMACAEDE